VSSARVAWAFKAMVGAWRSLVDGSPSHESGGDGTSVRQASSGPPSTLLTMIPKS